METIARRRRPKWPYWITLIILLVGYAWYSLHHPLPLLKPANTPASLTISPAGSHLSWPPSGQSAVGILGTDTVETHGLQKPTPTASTAKVITVLTVLEAKPLAKGQPGPTITLTANDVALYNQYAAQDGSLVPVTAGEQISEYQMLQAILLPSANNMADSLAIWAYGSIKNYQAAANAYLSSHGLSHTHVGDDASGMSPTTTSTAGDLVRLGQLAMQNAVVADIVGQASATGIPVVSSVKNVNMLLGTAGIIGVKTGNTDQAGGVFISASRVSVNGKPVTIVTAVAGTPDLFSALKYSLDLVKSAQANFSPTHAVTPGEIVGHYKIPWGGTVDAIASQGITINSWNVSPTQLKISTHPVTYNAQNVGTITLPASPWNAQQTVPLKLSQPISPPSAWWRLTHP